MIADDAAKTDQRRPCGGLFVRCQQRHAPQDGMEKVLMGLTDLKQVRSVHQVTPSTTVSGLHLPTDVPHV
jgi:hypothetical protein